VTGFLGPNGAGKSSTMRMLVGLDRPDAGQATINGKSYRELRLPLREVGAMVEARSFHPGRSARAHLSALAEANDISGRRVEAVLALVGLEAVARRRADQHLAALAASNGIARGRVDEVLGLVGLADVARTRAGKFSLGMAQRLGIAAALLGDPGIVILDEPVNGLDPEGVHWIRTLMKSLAAEGRTVLVSSHLISEVARTADDVIVIGQGRLLAHTTVADLSATGGSLEDAFFRLTESASEYRANEYTGRKA